MFRPNQCRVWVLVLAVSGTFVSCSGDRVLEWSAAVGPGKNLGMEFSRLEQAGRIVIENHGKTVKSLTDPASIRAVATLFQRHPWHWTAISAVFPDYDLVALDGGTQIERLGISFGSPMGPSKSTISVGDYYQRVPAAEVASLAKTLDVRWPALREPQQ